MRILLVEDDPLIAFDLAGTLENEGHVIEGPYASVREALAAIGSEPLDCALLDVNLGHETSFPIADELQRQEIPFALVTGHDISILPAEHRHRPILQKPYRDRALLKLVSSLEAAARQGSGSL